MSRSSRHEKRHCFNHSKSEGSFTFLRTRSSVDWKQGRGGSAHSVPLGSQCFPSSSTSPAGLLPATGTGTGVVLPTALAPDHLAHMHLVKQPSVQKNPCAQTHLLLVHVDSDAGLQVGALDAREVSA